jgi:DivIVA domain-containing protein
MNRATADRIRRATFPIARRGYSTRAVDRFLELVADWLESGRGDPARAELLKRELERIGHRAAGILAEAEEAAERLRVDAEHDAARIIRRAREEAAALVAAARDEAERELATAQRRARRPASGATRGVAR